MPSPTRPSPKRWARRAERSGSCSESSILKASGQESRLSQARLPWAVTAYATAPSGRCSVLQKSRSGPSLGISHPSLNLRSNSYAQSARLIRHRWQPYQNSCLGQSPSFPTPLHRLGESPDLRLHIRSTFRPASPRCTLPLESLQLEYPEEIYGSHNAKPIGAPAPNRY